MIRLVQLQHPGQGRRVALVQEPRLGLLAGCDSLYSLLETAFAQHQVLTEALKAARPTEWLDYDPIYLDQSDWRVLPPFDHPAEPARCLVTGTGLTHKRSAQTRQDMHADKLAPVTDSQGMDQRG